MRCGAGVFVAPGAGVGVAEGPGSARADSGARSAGGRYEPPTLPPHAVMPASRPAKATAVMDRGTIGFLIAVLCSRGGVPPRWASGSAIGNDVDAMVDVITNR